MPKIRRRVGVNNNYMKKFLLVFGMMVIAMMSYAQGTKRVAILEVVDKESKLTYSQKLVLRSNMARAVANTPGYEAYDRSDVDAIMSEHEFQRTGLVSDVEIRKLGEMTGVSLILITEAVVLDDGKLFVSAKILNVETARVEMMDNVNMDIVDMQNGCNSLASKLFGTNAVFSASSRYKITRLGGDNYAYQNMTLDEKAYMHFLQNNCPEAYAQHKKGKLMADGGWAAFAVGLAMTGIGAGLIIAAEENYESQLQRKRTISSEIEKIARDLEIKYGKDWSILWTYYKNEPDVQEALLQRASLQREKNLINPTDPTDTPMGGAGIALVVIGPCVTIASIPLLHFGYKIKKKSVDVYNANCISSSAQTLSLNLTSGRDGLGLALQF